MQFRDLLLKNNTNSLLHSLYGKYKSTHLILGSDINYYSTTVPRQINNNSSNNLTLNNFHEDDNSILNEENILIGRKDSFDIIIENLPGVKNLSSDLINDNLNSNNNNNNCRSARAATLSNINEKEKDTRSKWQAIHKRVLKLHSTMLKQDNMPISIENNNVAITTNDNNSNVVTNANNINTNISSISHSVSILQTRLFIDIHELIYDSIYNIPQLYGNTVGEFENTGQIIYSLLGDCLKVYICFIIFI